MARPKFLIDECLSVELPMIAHERGHEAYHVVHRGLAGAKDHHLRALLIQEGLALVTNNGDDFLKLYKKDELHPGLVIIVPNVAPAHQSDLFEAALQRIGDREDLINTVIEVHSAETIDEYEWPEGRA